MLCEICGTENMDYVKFCKRCGSSIVSQAVQQSTHDVSDLKKITIDYSSKIKNLEKDVNKLKNFLRNIKKLKNEYKEAKKTRHEILNLVKNEKDISAHMESLKKELSTEIRDAKYYKYRNISYLKGHLDYLNTQVKIIDKENKSNNSAINDLEHNMISNFEKLKDEIEGNWKQMNSKLNDFSRFLKHLSIDMENLKSNVESFRQYNKPRQGKQAHQKEIVQENIKQTNLAENTKELEEKIKQLEEMIKYNYSRSPVVIE